MIVEVNYTKEVTKCEECPYYHQEIDMGAIIPICTKSQIILSSPSIISTECPFDTEAMCNFCEEQLPYNTNYGAIWLDKTDKIGNLKWTSKQCPPFAECSAKDVDIVNTIKIKYCPMCGKKLDH